LHLLEKYGPSSFLAPMYGISEFCQAFCRLCAVYGGIYVLKRQPEKLNFDKEKNLFKSLMDPDGQELSSNFLVSSLDYVPKEWINTNSKRYVNRCVCVTNTPFKENDRQSILVIPPGTFGNDAAINVLQLSYDVFVCPKDKYLVHFTTESSDPDPKSLRKAVSSLLSLESSEKPKILYCAYFSFEIKTISDPKLIPDNVFVTNDPDTLIHNESPLEQAQSIFSKMYPTEEYFPKAPNPEDLVWEQDAEKKE